VLFCVKYDWTRARWVLPSSAAAEVSSSAVLSSQGAFRVHVHVPPGSVSELASAGLKAAPEKLSLGEHRNFPLTISDQTPTVIDEFQPSI